MPKPTPNWLSHMLFPKAVYFGTNTAGERGASMLPTCLAEKQNKEIEKKQETSLSIAVWGQRKK